MNVLLSNLIASIKVSVKHKVFKSKTRHSKFIEIVVKKLVSLGIILKYENITIGSTPYLVFEVNVISGQPMLHDIKCISKSGRKIYDSYKNLRSYLAVFKGMLVSTSKGVLSYEECIANKIGGEVLLVYT